jgi:peptidyl-prolyl cis-trans isomerase C
VLLLGLLLFSCTKKEEPQPSEPEQSAPELRILATVNGDPITLGEFNERYARAGLKPEKEAERGVREEFLNRIIERKMLVKEAQRRRFKVSLPEINARIETVRREQGKDVKETLSGLGVDFEKWKSDVWEDMMIEKLVSREVGGNVPVSAAEIRQYYNANQYEYERPEQVRVRQIVVASAGEAQQILEQIKAGADFAALAREKSTAPEAAEGGDLGYFAMGDMPGEFNVVFGLPRGGVSGVVKSPYGFHLFKLEDKRKAGKISLQEASKEIAGKLKHRKQDQRYRQWLTELRSRTKFVVNYQALE